MQIIGLTGGIASGKSTVSKVLGELGAIVIDVDKLAHKAMEPHNPAWTDIVNYFGREILAADMTIDREKLGQVVFNDPDKLKKLNAITHPRIHELVKQQIHCLRLSQPDALVFVEVPLLYESNQEKNYDEVWVVWVDRETQIKRLMQRNGLDRGLAIKRIESQMPLDEKAKRADVVIDNSKGVEETIKVVSQYFAEKFGRKQS
ncbi:MAG: dephospho-CoA kinase [Syntrophomonadaceae bacterium]|nr:dephospho-CoA kinase [Syntrophomonadaceae bacterium]